MKKIFLPLLSLLCLLSCNPGQNQAPAVHADANTMADADSMIADPTRIVMSGELPSRKSLPVLFYEMDYQQALQTYLWGLPMVTMAQWEYIHENTFGAKSGDLVVYNSYEDKLGILTGNATTPYIIGFVDLAKSGPVVIEMPAGHTAGGLSDIWQREEAVIGELGPDKGKGGKYLLVPPTMKESDIPGYYIIHCKTMNNFFGFRALDPDPKKTDELIHGVKTYPYAQRKHPTGSKVITPSRKKFLAIAPDGMAYWERLNAILQEEPVEERDRFFASWLNNLGIIKGKPFNPTERQKDILTAASERGKEIAMANSFAKRFDSVHHWADRKWDYVMVMTDPSQRAENYDEFFRRSSYFFEAVTFSKAMITKTPNLGQAYLASYVDKDNNWLNGGSSYKLHVPANPPAVNFWSVTIYDAATRCMIDNSQRNADLSSRKDLTKNADGSVDLYFAPSAPAGLEKNWVQTIPGKHWFAYMRFYGPTKAYFDKSWKMDDIIKTN